MRTGKSLILSKTQKEILQRISTQRTNTVQMVERSKIILEYNRTWSKTKTLQSLNSTWDKVNRWVNRWQNQENERADLEQAYLRKQVGRKAYATEIEKLLHDEQRPGAPSTFTESQKQQIIALATQKPEDAGIPITHWSHEILAQTAIEKGIVLSISSTHIGTFLKCSNIATTPKQLLGASEY